MSYLISGGATEEMARVTRDALRLYASIGAYLGKVSQEDVDFAKKLVETEFGGFDLDEKDMKK